jgi:hypothetical protein
MRRFLCQHRVVLVLSASCALASCRPDNGTPATDDALPAEWRIEDIAAAVRSPQTHFSASGTYVLAWKETGRKEGAEPVFTSAQCLVLKEFRTTDGKQLWVLAFVSSGFVRGTWREDFDYAMRVDGLCCQIPHRREFEKCPTNKDVYAFMDSFEWQLGPQTDSQIVRGRVCRDTWKRVIGAEPTRSFKK